MGITPYIPIFTSISLFLLGSFGLYKRKSNPLLVPFSIFCYCASIWQFDMSLLYTIKDLDTLYVWRRFPRIATMMIAPSALNFIYPFIKKSRKSLIFIGVMLIGVYFSVYRVIYYTGETYYRAGATYMPAKSILLYAYYIFTFAIAIYAIYLQIANYKNAVTPIEKTQYNYMFLAWTVFIVLNLDVVWMSYGIKLLPFRIGPLAVLIFLSIIAYAILKHNLMDVGVVIKRATYFAFLILFITLPFLMGMEYFQEKYLAHETGNTLLMRALPWALLFLLYDKLKSYLQKITDKVFFLKEYNSDAVISEITGEIQSISDIDQLISKMDRILTNTFRIDSIGMFIMDNMRPQYYYINKESTNKRSDLVTIKIDSPILNPLKDPEKNWLVYNEIANKDKYSELKSIMDKFKANLLVSSISNNLVTGFFVLPEKKSGKLYNLKDIGILSNVINQCMLVISKIREMEEKAKIHTQKEVEEKHRKELESKNILLNEQKIEIEKAYDQIKKQSLMLIKQERQSSMNDMVAGVAHEINTPLMAISLGMNYLKKYVLQLREHFNNSQDKTTQNESFQKKHDSFDENAVIMYDSLESIRSHIQNMKSFIKFQEDAYGEFDVNEEIQTTLRILSFKQPSHIEIKNMISTDLPKLKGNAADFNQLIMSVIVNAFEAIPESKNGLIEIYSAVEDNNLAISIKDNGTGIDKKYQNKLFKEDFSTKKESGIGMGLTLCKEIIDQHQGSIRLTSSAQGTTCTIALPV